MAVALFLMSKASMNRFFGTMYFDFSTPSQSYQVRRVFHHHESGPTAFAMGMALAGRAGVAPGRPDWGWPGARPAARIRR